LLVVGVHTFVSEFCATTALSLPNSPIPTGRLGNVQVAGVTTLRIVLPDTLGATAFCTMIAAAPILFVPCDDGPIALLEINKPSSPPAEATGCPITFVPCA